MIRHRFASFNARQSSFSIVCSGSALLFFLTAVFHLVWAPPSAQDQFIVWCVASIAPIFVAVPLIMGRRYPRVLGILGIFLALVGLNVVAVSASSPQLILNAVLLLPVIAITCGWFVPGRVARPAMLVSVALFLVLLALRSDVNQWPALSTTTLIYAALLTGFLFEAGVFIHRRTDQQASHDPLTGALNRYGFARDGEIELHRARRSGAPLTVVAIDFDNFKALNDTRGHLAGDLVLRQAADEWRAGMRPYDYVVRLGGDEFALMLPGIAAANAQHIVDRLRAGSAVSWSAGIAEWEPGESLDALLERADAELLVSRAAKDLPQTR